MTQAVSREEGEGSAGYSFEKSTFNLSIFTVLTWYVNN
jgi:hypothetical protein